MFVVPAGISMHMRIGNLDYIPEKCTFSWLTDNTAQQNGKGKIYVKNR